MSPATWNRIKDLYNEATALPSDQRQPFLDSIQAVQPREAAEVIRLLRLDSRAGQKLEPAHIPAGILASMIQGRTFFPGQRLANRYEIIRFLASGGMGEVYEAHDLDRLERIAIKTIRPDLAREEHLAWLRREVDSARRIQHPNICRVYDLVQADEATFLTMELLEGETLAAYLSRNGSLNERQALPWLRQILAGLAAAHQAGVIHRDFKPGNVMIVPRPNSSPRLVVMDFGLSRHTSQDSQTSYSSQTWSAAAGTPAYMAPEQILGRRTSRATDIYAFGLVLFEMLSGHLPFTSDSPLNMAVRKTQEGPPSILLYAPTLRPSWAAVIRKCLSQKPSDRFSSVEEILPALESRSTRVWRSRLILRNAKRFATQSKTRVAVTILLCLFVSAAWLLWPRTPSPEAQLHWQRGIQALHADEPVVALQAFENSIAAGNPPWRVHSDLALAWHAIGATPRAKAQLASAHTLFRSSDEVQYRNAVSAWLDAAKPKAIEILTQRANPNNPQSLADLAWFSSGPNDRWRTVAKLQPAYAAAHFHLADAAAKAGKWREAESEFQLAQSHFSTLNLDKLSKSVAARRGQRRFEAGDTQLALRDLSSLAAFPSSLGIAACEHAVVLTAGVPDNFALPGDKIDLISPRFTQMKLLADKKSSRAFDDNASNEEQFFSLPLPPYRICGAKLEVKIRRGSDPSGSDNDYLILGAAPFTGNSSSQRIPLWADLRDFNERTAVHDLTADIFDSAFLAYSGQPQAFIDFIVGDDTILDYLKLTIFY